MIHTTSTLLKQNIKLQMYPFLSYCIPNECS